MLLCGAGVLRRCWARVFLAVFPHDTQMATHFTSEWKLSLERCDHHCQLTVPSPSLARRLRVGGNLVVQCVFLLTLPTLHNSRLHITPPANRVLYAITVDRSSMFKKKKRRTIFHHWTRVLPVSTRLDSSMLPAEVTVLRTMARQCCRSLTIHTGSQQPVLAWEWVGRSLEGFTFEGFQV